LIAGVAVLSPVIEGSMAKAARGAPMIEIRCSRCERHGRLSVQRLLAEWGPDASIRDSRSVNARTATTRSSTHGAIRIARPWWSCFLPTLRLADMADMPPSPARLRSETAIPRDPLFRQDSHDVGEGEMRCVLLVTLLLLSGCSAGGCTLSDGTHVDAVACTDD